MTTAQSTSATVLGIVSVILTGAHYSMQVFVDVLTPTEPPSQEEIDDNEWWHDEALVSAIELIKSYYGWDIESTIIDVGFECDEVIHYDLKA